MANLDMRTSIFSNVKVEYGVVFLAALVLYVATCASGPLWQDSGVYQYRIWHNDIEGKLGLALSHPLYHLIGIGVKYICFGEFAYRVNLISSVAGAFAVANLFLLLRLWLRKNLPAIVAAVTLLLSHTFWRHAVIAEDYTMYAALLLAELLMLLQYVKTKRAVFLYLLGLFNGLAIATHMFASISFICYLIFLVVLLAKKQIRFRDFGIVAWLWIIGAVPYEYLIINKYIQTGDFTATLASAFFGQRWRSDVFNMALSFKIVKENVILLAYNFPTPNVLFFFAGLYGLRKVSPDRGFKNVLLSLLVIFFIFAFRYTVPDRYAFFIPFYCLSCILIGVGIDFCISLAHHKILPYLIFALALLPIPTYIIAPVTAEKLRFNLGTKREIPYRNEYRWFLRPWRTGSDSTERFVNEIFDTVVQNAIIWADTTTVPPLLYAQQVKGRRGDVKIISGLMSSEGSPEFNENSIDKLLEERPIYVVSAVDGYCPQFLLGRYSFERAGIIWRVVKKGAE
jgi:4-amino-4-deoxy-L-arabinose transferase-like glycosyltransferase